MDGVANVCPICHGPRGEGREIQRRGTVLLRVCLVCAAKHEVSKSKGMSTDAGYFCAALCRDVARTVSPDTAVELFRHRLDTASRKIIEEIESHEVDPLTRAKIHIRTLISLAAERQANAICRGSSRGSRTGLVAKGAPEPRCVAASVSVPAREAGSVKTSSATETFAANRSIVDRRVVTEAKGVPQQCSNVRWPTPTVPRHAHRIELGVADDGSYFMSKEAHELVTEVLASTVDNTPTAHEPVTTAEDRQKARRSGEFVDWEALARKHGGGE